MRFRKKEAEALPRLDTTKTQPREEMEEIEDETMLLMDSGEEVLPPRATLKVVKAPEVKPGVIYPILGTTKIGRSENNEIHIQEKSISRKHAEIYFDGGTFFIRDLGSKYGTRQTVGCRLAPVHTAGSGGTCGRRTWASASPSR